MKKIAINICTPHQDEKTWGDTAFAENLASELNKIGFQCKIFTKDNWKNSQNLSITLTITGKFHYNPNPKNFNIIWVISHPECRTPEELNKYDLVFIASEKFYNLVKNDIKPETFLLEQATNQKLFTSKNKEKDIEILFVGNNYYDNLKQRVIIKDLLKTRYADLVRVVGSNWEKGIDKSQIIADFVDYSKLPELYSRAKIVLNDHHGLMKEYGFINNRTFDLISLGVFQISDYVESIEKYGIVTYQNYIELEEKISEFLFDRKIRKRQIKISQKLSVKIDFKYKAQIIKRKIKND